MATIDHAEREAHRLRNGVLSAVALIALAISVGLAVPGLRGVLGQVTDASAGWLLLAVVLELGSCLGYVAMVRLVLSHGPAPQVRWLAWAEMAFGVLLPLGGAGGLAVGAWAMRIDYVVLDIAALWACLRAVGITAPILALVVGYELGYLANILPIPGGIGALDGGLVGALLLYGLPAGQTAAAVLIYHAIVLIAPTPGGAVAFARLRRSISGADRARVLAARAAGTGATLIPVGLPYSDLSADENVIGISSNSL